MPNVKSIVNTGQDIFIYVKKRCHTFTLKLLKAAAKNKQLGHCSHAALTCYNFKVLIAFNSFKEVIIRFFKSPKSGVKPSRERR